MSTSPKRLAALASAALAVAGITILAPPAQAAAGHGLVISEVYGRRRQQRRHVQRRLRRAVQPHRQQRQPGRLVGPVPLRRGQRGRDRLDGPDRLDRRRCLLPDRGGGGSGWHHRPAHARRGGRNHRHRRRRRPDLARQHHALLDPSDGNVADAADRRLPRRRHDGHVLETAAVASNAGNTTSAYRFPVAEDTNNNNTDFLVGSPSPKAPGAGGPFTGTIAEIQGTGTDRRPRTATPPPPPASSPRRTPPVASTASTCRPPAPAARATPTPDASDAIFVYVGASGARLDPGRGRHGDVVGMVTRVRGMTQIDATVTADPSPTAAPPPRSSRTPARSRAPTAPCRGPRASAAPPSRPCRRRTRASCGSPPATSPSPTPTTVGLRRRRLGHHGLQQHVRRDRPGGQLHRAAGRRRPRSSTPRTRPASPPYRRTTRPTQLVLDDGVEHQPTQHRWHRPCRPADAVAHPDQPGPGRCRP